MQSKCTYPKGTLSDPPLCWMNLSPPTSADLSQVPAAREPQRGHRHTLSSGLSGLGFLHADKGVPGTNQSNSETHVAVPAKPPLAARHPLGLTALGLPVSHHSRQRWPQGGCAS